MIKRRLLALLTAVTMIIALMPVIAFANDEWDVTGVGKDDGGLYIVQLNNGKARLEVKVTGDNSSPSYKWQREIVSDDGTTYPYIGSNLPYLDVTEAGWYCCYVYKNGGDQAEVDFRVVEVESKVEPAPEPVVKKGDVLKRNKTLYTVTKVAKDSTAGTVAFTKAKNTKNVTVPEKVKLEGKTYKVTKIKANAFKGSKIRKVTVSKNVTSIAKNALKGSKATMLVIKSKKLTKKSSVKGSLKGSKIKTVQVNVGSKSQNKKYIAKYKKVFTKKNAGRKVTVK